MIPTPARVATVWSFPATRPGIAVFIAGTISPPRQLEPRWRLPGLDQPMDVRRAAGVEEHVALPDRRLLGEQPVGEQGLADVLRELAVVAREPAREVGEVGVVAAPLAHAVEALEDAAGDA